MDLGPQEGEGMSPRLGIFRLVQAAGDSTSNKYVDDVCMLEGLVVVMRRAWHENPAVFFAGFIDFAVHLCNLCLVCAIKS